jgi:hypothetical protein
VAVMPLRGTDPAGSISPTWAFSIESSAPVKAKS